MNNEIYYQLDTPNYTRTVVRLPDTKTQLEMGWSGRFKETVVNRFSDPVVTITLVNFYYGVVNEDRSQCGTQNRHVYQSKYIK